MVHTDEIHLTAQGQSRETIFQNSSTLISIFPKQRDILWTSPSALKQNENLFLTLNIFFPTICNH